MKTTFTRTVVALVIVSILVGGGLIAFAPWFKEDMQRQIDAEIWNQIANAPDGITYACDDNRSIRARYGDTTTMQPLIVVLDDGREIKLTETATAFGQRYVSETETIIFWMKDYNASLEENRVTTYKDCIYSPPQESSQ